LEFIFEILIWDQEFCILKRPNEDGLGMV